MQNNPQLSAEMEKRFNKIMLEWIESQWKIEQAHQNGEPYTRMKFEADANNVEKKLKHFIATAITQERNKVIEEIEEAIMPLTRYMRSIYRADHSDGEPLQDMLLEDEVKDKLNQLKGSDE